MALALPTAQQKCDEARIKAWAKYVSCVDGVVAKDAKGVYSDWAVESAAFAKCRHTYFKNWTTLEKSASLLGSSCNLTDNRTNPPDPRYTDNGDQTVTDNLSGLVWEKKDNAGGIHDKDNWYTWSAGSPYKESGTAFTTFLTGAGTGLNVAGFAGANGWRLPTLAELQTIVLDFACTGAFGGAKCSCPSSPCVDPALDAANTQSDNYYWSATSDVRSPGIAWFVGFSNGVVGRYFETDDSYVRAVRGGW